MSSLEKDPEEALSSSSANNVTHIITSMQTTLEDNAPQSNGGIILTNQGIVWATGK